LTVRPLSLTAELFLLSMDPDRGGLLPLNRGRFHRALQATFDAEHASPRGDRHARRSALLELENAALIGPRRLPGPRRLTDRKTAATHFRCVYRCLEDGGLAERRDWELLVLLTWCGVLAHRLSRDERRIAIRRLRQLLRLDTERGQWQPPGEAPQPIPAWIPELGGIAALASDIAHFEAPDIADFGIDHSGFKPFG
jgi:hypothetical protein